MTIFNWFSIPIYEKSLFPPEQVEKEMLFYMREYDSNLYSLEKNKQKKNITGDTDGNADIANLREFSWLVEEVSREATEYLKELNVDMDNIDLFVQKSWPVVCSTDGGYVSSHRHLNSHLSCVYYIQKECSKEAGGSLRFWMPDNHPLNTLPVRFKDGCRTDLSTNFIDYDFSKNMLIIFPSMVSHEVTRYVSNIPRYSVSFDIMICSKMNTVDNDEMVCANPSRWKKI